MLQIGQKLSSEDLRIGLEDLGAFHGLIPMSGKIQSSDEEG